MTGFDFFGGGLVNKQDLELRQEKVQWLKRFRQTNSEIILCCEGIQFWQEKGTQMAGCYEWKVRGGPHQDIGDIAARIVDIQFQLYHKMVDLMVLQREIQGKINAISDPRLRHLLELRYLEGLTMEAAAERMNYSWRQVQRLHVQALDALPAVSFQQGCHSLS